MALVDALIQRLNGTLEASDTPTASASGYPLNDEEK